MVSLLFAACAVGIRQEDPSGWYDPGTGYEVAEPIAFTDVNYGFTGETPIAELPAPADFETAFAPDDFPADADCADWVTSEALPAEITGIVTVLPRFYYKSNGCYTEPGDNDEKFYGSYFVQDASGGFFVLGDSKVAHFDVGARVTLTVRAVRESYDQLMIAAHDVVEVDLGPEPVYYEAVAGALGPEHVSRVVRVEGTVATAATTFGEIYVDGDDGTRWKFSLDVELSRRGVEYPPGARLQVTGPVLYSYSEYTIVVMRVGQVTEL